MIAHALVGPLLQIFFTDHLVAQRCLSLQTVASYRDTFRLLLQFVRINRSFRLFFRFAQDVAHIDEGYMPHAESTSPASFSLAGFQVTLIGRFWVTPEDTKIVDWVRHSVEEGNVYVCIRFMDKTEFSLQFSPHILTDGIDLSDMSTGNFKMIREYYRRQDE